MRLFVPSSHVMLLLLAALIAATTPQSAIAEAQFEVPLPLNYVDIDAGALTTAAFSQPYGRLLATEFGAVLGESADAVCLKSGGITKERIVTRARRILVERGKQLFETTAKTVDRTVFMAKLLARGVPNANAERQRLRNDSVVRTYVTMAQPMVLAGAAGIVIENVDRFALIRRIRLARPVGPLASGKDELLRADPTDEVLDKLDEYVASHDSPALTRYLELTDIVQKALSQSFDRDAAMKVGPVQFLAGLDKDIAGLCVFGPR